MRKRRSFKNEQSEAREAPKSKAGMYMAIFIAAVMVLSIGGVFLSNPSSESDYSYNGHDFKNSNNMWVTKIDGKEITFYFLPQEVETLDVSKQAVDIIKNSQGLIITSNPVQDTTSKLQVLDIFKLNFVNSYLKRYSEKKAGLAVTQKTNASKLPVLTCENSSYSYPMVSVDFSNETNIKMDDDCVVISVVDEYGMLAILDNLRYKLFGILT